MWDDDNTNDDSAGFADQMPSLPVVILGAMLMLGLASIINEFGKSQGFWS